MSSMFEGCSSLTSLSLKKFKTNSITVMNKMFKDCSKLEKLEINFDTKKVYEMSEMFSNDINLRELDLSSFDTRNLNSWENIFNGIDNLTITIDKEKNEKILTNLSDGIHIIDINGTNL